MKPFKHLILLVICLACICSGTKIPWNNSMILFGIQQLNDNCTLMVEQGTYQLPSLAGVSNKSNIAIISKDGPGKAVVSGPGPSQTNELITFNKCNNVLIEGMELKNGGDNNLKFGGCTNVTVKDCYIHTANGQGDCIKICRAYAGTTTVFSEDILVKNTILHTPGLNSGVAGTEFEENLDFMHTRRALVQDCWLFHVDTLGNQISYPKGDCEDIVYDRCLVGPQSNISTDPAVGGGWSGSQVTGYNVTNLVMRNCVFIDCPSGAIGSYGTKNHYIYNNTLINCAHRTRLSPSMVGIIHIKHGGDVAVNNDNFFIYNNIFFNNKRQVVYIFVKQGNMLTVTNVNHDYNLYYNEGRTYSSTAEYNPSTESNRVTTNPYPGSAPVFPPLNITSSTTFADLDALKKTIIENFKTPANSPGVDKGTDGDAAPYPGVTTDIQGASREKGSYDIGAYEPSVSGIRDEFDHVDIEGMDIKVWPSPFSTSISIKISMQNAPFDGVYPAQRRGAQGDKWQNANLKIFDLSGRQVYSSTVPLQADGISRVWNATDNTAGMYIIRVIAGNSEYKKRIVLLN